MCRDAVAAPRALQLIIYPISLKKSLLFCEKIEKIKLFFRKEIKSENCAGTKAFSDGLQNADTGFPPHRSEFRCGRGPGQPAEGLPDANALFQHNTAGAKGQSILHCAACTLPCST